MIATSEKGLSVLDAVATYKERTELASGFSAAQGCGGDAAEISSD